MFQELLATYLAYGQIIGVIVAFCAIILTTTKDMFEIAPAPRKIKPADPTLCSEEISIYEFRYSNESAMAARDSAVELVEILQRSVRQIAFSLLFLFSVELLFMELPNIVPNSAILCADGGKLLCPALKIAERVSSYWIALRVPQVLHGIIKCVLFLGGVYLTVRVVDLVYNTLCGRSELPTNA